MATTKKQNFLKDAHMQRNLTIISFVSTFTMYFHNRSPLKIIIRTGQPGIHRIHHTT